MCDEDKTKKRGEKKEGVRCASKAVGIKCQLLARSGMNCFALLCRKNGKKEKKEKKKDTHATCQEGPKNCSASFNKAAFTKKTKKNQTKQIKSAAR